MLNDFITIDYLATFAGMVLVLGIIVQFTKGLVKKTFEDWVVRIYAFIIAIILGLLVAWYQGLLSVATGRELAAIILLVLINAVIVTIAAMGGYEVFTDPGATKEKSE